MNEQACDFIIKHFRATGDPLFRVSSQGYKKGKLLSRPLHHFPFPSISVVPTNFRCT